MGKATRCVRVRSVAGHVLVDVSDDFGPLKDLLETDIGSELSELRFLLERLRGRHSEPWGFGSDSCHVTVGDDVLVENDFTGQHVVLSRDEFVRLLDEYAGAVTHQNG